MMWADSLSEVFITVIFWVLILHHTAPLQAASYADDVFTPLRKHNPKYCEDLCRKENLNLRNRSPTLSMLLRNISPLEFKVYRRSNTLRTGNNPVREVMDLLCDCGVRRYAAAKHWTDFLMLSNANKKRLRMNQKCPDLAKCTEVKW